MSTMFQTQTTPSVLPATGNQLVGYGAAFNSWARISTPQGAFMEKVAPGAFRKTLQERGDKVRVLLEHGKDARAGQQAAWDATQPARGSVRPRLRLRFVR